MRNQFTQSTKIFQKKEDLVNFRGYKLLLQNTSKEFRKYFLLIFTRELIKHTKTGETAFLKKAVKEEEKEFDVTKLRRKEIKDIIKAKETELKLIKEEKPLVSPIRKPIIHKNTHELGEISRMVLKVPKPKSNLQEVIRPTPTLPREKIELGKLTPFVNDRNVEAIECNGPGEDIKVKVPKIMNAGINLSAEEIDEILTFFSEKTKIPVSEGVYKVIYKNLELSAIISKVVGTKFIIRKLRVIPRRI
jgi:hypothetical protein